MTDFCTPLDGHPLEILPEIVSDPYRPPPAGKDGRHMGVDFAYYQWDDRTTIEGVEVHAVSAGTVAAALTTNNIPYGYAVIIETPAALLPGPLRNYLELESESSMYILYAHMLEPPKVKIGDSIHCGDFLGLVGQTGGESTPYEIPHLHLETRFGASGKIFPEMGFYSTRVSEEARALYLTWRTSGEFEPFDPMDLFQAINQFDE